MLPDIFVGMNYVNGSFQPHKSDFPDLNPSNDEIIGYFPQIPQQVDEAVSAARHAFSGWRSRSRIERGEFLDKLAQLLKENMHKIVEVISLETGKNKNESLAEVNEALHMCQYAASLGRMPYGELIASELSEKDAYMLRKPKGVVAVISPWNFPVAIGGFWSSAMALIEGNTVVWKPSEETPMSAQIIVELYDKAEFPQGVINLVHGDGRIGQDLVQSDVDCVLFTGSAEVGSLIKHHCASTRNKSCACEMGSKSAVIVDDPLDDGLLNMCLEACVASCFKLSGQRCVSAGRLIIHRNIFETFKNLFLERVSALRIGSPADPKNFFGPLINKTQIARVEHYNDLVRKSTSAQVLIDGQRIAGKGNFITPFVYQTEWMDVPYLKNEVFGPHVALIPFDSIEDAVRIYNDTVYGLSVAVFTSDFRTARKLRDECDYGMMYWNGGTIGAESHLNFGGVKGSGYGHASAAGTVDAVTHKVSLTVNYGNKMKWAQGLK